jgi:CIC family chloride channel protein
VLSGDGEQVQGWITSASVLQAVAAEIGTAPPTARSRPAGPDQDAPGAEPPPDPLPGYEVLEVTLGPDSPAAGTTLGSIRWPSGIIPVAVLRRRRLQEPDPALTLVAGDRVSLLAPAPGPGGRGPGGASGSPCSRTAPASAIGNPP